MKDTQFKILLSEIRSVSKKVDDNTASIKSLDKKIDANTTLIRKYHPEK